MGYLAVFVVAILLAGGCSGDDDTSTGSRSTGFPARTLAAVPGSASTTGPTEDTQPSGATVGRSRVTLRIEGDAGTEFSGVCTTSTENSVLVGKVPKTYNFDLRNRALSCQIKKQGPGTGSLQAILLTGDNTRSIQQTRSRNSTINISYSSG